MRLQRGREDQVLIYAKGKALSPIVGGSQSAAAFGLLREYAHEEGSELDKSICVTLNAFSAS
jgi:hypothetical protein